MMTVHIVMIRSAVAATVVFLSFASTSATAEYVSGNKLNELCSSSDPAELMFCIGFITGVADGVVALPNQHGLLPRLQACMSPNAPPGQIAAVVSRYLSTHPEKLHISASALAIVALLEAFPCPQD